MERLIAADADRVWKLISDLDRWDRMLPTMQKVSRLDADDPVGIGARFEVRRPGLLMMGAKTRRMVEQEADTFVGLAESGDGGDAGVG